MRRVVAGVVAAGVLLAGCSHTSTPKITVQGDGKAVAVTASTYCLDAKHCRSTRVPDLPVLTVAASGKVRVGVPGPVAKRGWQVRMLDLPSGGQQALGASPALQGDRSYQVAGNTAGGNPFLVEVDQLAQGRPDGSRWSFLVRPTK